MDVNWIALVLVVLGLYLAFKLIGAALKLLMWLVVLAGAYWFVAPLAGWPTLSDVVYVFGPDFDGQRIEEVFTPARMADALGERVVEGAVERLRMPEPALQELPEPLRRDGAFPAEAPAEAAGGASGEAPGPDARDGTPAG